MGSVAPAWSNPWLLAPMEGVGAPGMRDLFAHYGGPGLVCAPFVRITDQSPNLSWLRSQLHRTADVPLSVQLLGSHSEHMALAARCLADAGTDVVDLNLGCPSRQAVKKGVGAALLSSVDDISRIVAAMRAACHVQLSVKIRAGDGTAGGVVRLAKAIEAAGADFLTLHPRTRQQGYRGVADWQLVRLVKSQVRIPVVGNGDCWYASDALRLMRKSGADAVMFGRPALRNPFIFRQVKELVAGREPYVPTGGDIVCHVERLAATLRAEIVRRRHSPVGALKEQIMFLLQAVPEPAHTLLWQRARRAIGLPEVIEAIRPLRELERLDMAADGPLRLKTTPADPG